MSEAIKKLFTMFKQLCIFALLLMVLLTDDLQAQNPLFDKWEIKELAPGGRIDAIADFGDGVVVAGTRRPNPGKIFRSEDFGKTWKMVQNIIDVSGNGSITCIARGRNKTAYLLTGEGAFWRSEDNGISWNYLNTITTNKNKYGFAATYSIMVTKLGTVLITDTDSEGGHIYRSQNEGSTWQDIGKISNKGSYRFTDVGKGIIVNGWEGKVYISYDDGKDWQISGNLENDSPIWATEYMVTSHAIEGSKNGNIYVGNISTNKWKKVATLKGEADDFVYLGQGAVIYSTGPGGPGQRDIYLSLNYGKTWQNIGDVETKVDGDWLDHVIAIDSTDKVICIGGTGKGFIVRAEIKKTKLYRK